MSNTTGATCGTWSAYPSGAPEITPSFWSGSCCLFFSFPCCVMWSIVCLFVFFICRHGVVSLFSIYEFDCPSGTFRPSFIIMKISMTQVISSSISITEVNTEVLTTLLEIPLGKLIFTNSCIDPVVVHILIKDTRIEISYLRETHVSSTKDSPVALELKGKIK